MSYSLFNLASGTLPMQELSWPGYSTRPKPCTEYERLFPCLFLWLTCLISSADLSFLEVISNKPGIQTDYQFILHGCHNSIWLVDSFLILFFFLFSSWETCKCGKQISNCVILYIYWDSLTVCAFNLSSQSSNSNGFCSFAAAN